MAVVKETIYNRAKPSPMAPVPWRTVVNGTEITAEAVQQRLRRALDDGLDLREIAAGLSVGEYALVEWIHNPVTIPPRVARKFAAFDWGRAPKCNDAEQLAKWRGYLVYKNLPPMPHTPSCGSAVSYRKKMTPEEARLFRGARLFYRLYLKNKKRGRLYRLALNTNISRDMWRDMLLPEASVGPLTLSKLAYAREKHREWKRKQTNEAAPQSATMETAQASAQTVQQYHGRLTGAAIPYRERMTPEEARLLRGARLFYRLYLKNKKSGRLRELALNSDIPNCTWRVIVIPTPSIGPVTFKKLACARERHREWKREQVQAQTTGDAVSMAPPAEMETEQPARIVELNALENAARLQKALDRLELILRQYREAEAVCGGGGCTD